MIKQKIQGLKEHSIAANGSDEDMAALAKLLAGEVDIYRMVAQGGESCDTPSQFRKKKFLLSTTLVSGERYSTLFSVPHVKQTSDFNTMIDDISGKFECSYDENEGVKCEKVGLKFS